MGLISDEVKPSTIMGVDCSSKSFAFSIFKDGELRRYGEVRFEDGDIFRRMHNANKQMQAMADVFGKIDAIYFESSVFIQNKQTVILLAESLGAALSPLTGEGTQVYRTPVLQWQRVMNPALSKDDRAKIEKNNPDKSKSWIKERIRQEHKARGIQKVKELFGVEVTSNDISDAILIGLFGCLQHHLTELPK